MILKANKNVCTRPENQASLAGTAQNLSLALSDRTVTVAPRDPGPVDPIVLRAGRYLPCSPCLSPAEPEPDPARLASSGPGDSVLEGDSETTRGHDQLEV